MYMTTRKVHVAKFVRGKGQSGFASLKLAVCTAFMKELTP